MVLFSFLFVELKIPGIFIFLFSPQSDKLLMEVQKRQMYEMITNNTKIIQTIIN